MIVETQETAAKEELKKMASGVHGELATTISGYLFIYLLQNNRGRVFDGRTTYEISPDQPKKEPDVSFVKLERLPQNVDDTIRLAPDLAVQIISSNDDWKEIIKKAAIYLHAGVQLIWVVDPYTQSVFVFKPETGTQFQTLRGPEELKAEGLLPGFSLKVNQIFERTGPVQLES